MISTDPPDGRITPAMRRRVAAEVEEMITPQTSERDARVVRKIAQLIATRGSLPQGRSTTTRADGPTQWRADFQERLAHEIAENGVPPEAEAKITQDMREELRHQPALARWVQSHPMNMVILRRISDSLTGSPVMGAWGDGTLVLACSNPRPVVTSTMFHELGHAIGDHARTIDSARVDALLADAMPNSIGMSQDANEWFAEAAEFCFAWPNVNLPAGTTIGPVAFRAIEAILTIAGVDITGENRLFNRPYRRPTAA